MPTQEPAVEAVMPPGTRAAMVALVNAIESDLPKLNTKSGCCTSCGAKRYANFNEHRCRQDLEALHEKVLGLLARY